jgi:hypothetical protein
MAAEQTLEQWMAEFDEQSELADSNKTELLTKAEAVLSKFDPERKQAAILWRLAKATFKAAGEAEIAKDKSLHKQLLEKTLEFCDAAIAIEPDNGEAHSWAAYACGKLSDHLGVKER